LRLALQLQTEFLEERDRSGEVVSKASPATASAVRSKSRNSPPAASFRSTFGGVAVLGARERR